MGRIRSAKQFTVQGRSAGSALILVVVLTSLLAIVGVLFLMTLRIDKMSTSATVDNQELSYAVDSVITRIREELAQDVPLDPNGQVEYYDFPDVNDPWLADIEPYESEPNVYRWRQLSDVTGYLKRRGFATQNIDVDPPGTSKVIAEYPDIDVVDLPDGKRELQDRLADADGDGIADSKWIEFDDLKLSRGQPVYAAIRIVDHGAMLNANTGYRLDPDANDAWVDGHSQLQVNVLGLAVRLGLQPTRADEAELLGVWANNAPGVSASDLRRYEQEVIWRYGDPCGIWTPFDLSDELELRDRYCINGKTQTRMEAIWNTVGSDGLLYLVSEPYDSSRNAASSKATWRRLDDWRERVTSHPAAVEPDRRHLVTTYNMDRILTPRPLPDGRQSRKMINVNKIDNENLLYVLRDTIKSAVEEVYGGFGAGDTATQIAVNLKDYVDADDEVTVMAGTQTSNWAGFERPNVYISELACRLKRNPNTGFLYKSYAIELHKPYFEDRDPLRTEWYLSVDNVNAADVELEIAWSGTRRFHVALAEDSEASLKTEYLRFSDPDPIDAMPRFGYDPSAYGKREQNWPRLTLEEGATITLERRVGPSRTSVKVDVVRVPSGWIKEDDVARSIQRDVSPNRCIWRLWAPVTQVSTPGLGNASGNYVSGEARPVIQARPANKPMTNIGELGMIFARNAYYVQDTATPAELLVDLANPMYSRLFNYLTVMDPAEHGRRPDETRVMGRININTAPWFVLAQLPWMQYEPAGQGSGPFDRARAIVEYRNRSGRPFRSIGELMRITSRMADPNAVVDYPVLGLLPDGVDNQHSDAPRGPDVTPDTARDDFEERDLIFTRISNLVTVRSDVFTAYILVRIGTDGPQKRVIAILDRSQVNAPGDRVRVMARHLVPDPR
jgi:hypothetical protein